MSYKDPEDKKAYDNAYREKNKEKRKEYFKKRYEEKKEEINTHKREYYQRTREQHLETMRKYNKSHKEERKAYVEKNREHIKQRDNEYHKNRMATDENYRIKRNLRSRIAKALRGIGAKSDTTINLLGCSVEDFKKHIEAQFTEGMSWENYGHDSWHLDHRLPCDSFNLTDPDEQKECFHYTNMQPLWACDNLSKGSKILVDNHRVI